MENCVSTTLQMLKTHCRNLCREMRRVSDVPIFVFAGQHCERDKVNALDAGADDYIVKPLAMQEFLARIRAVLRRNSAQREHPIFVSNDLTIDFEQRTVCVAGKVMRLTPKEHGKRRLWAVSTAHFAFGMLFVGMA
jgi:two-component system KDP operon response regulator KdpE